MNKIFYLLIMIFLFIDLLTKRWAEMYLILGEKVPILPPWLNFELLHNSGASFGFLSGYTNILIVIQILGIGLLIYFYYTVNPVSMLTRLGFALMISGALGNFVDRLLLHFVIDFISISWYPAIFNIADLEIRGGALLLLFLYLTRKFK